MLAILRTRGDSSSALFSNLGFFILSDNIFLKIVKREIPAKIVYEDDLCMAFNDVHPQAPVHILLIPKEEIHTHADLQEKHKPLLGHMHLVAAKLAQENGLENGYRLIVNCKEDGGQTVPHLHMHLLGGRAMHWPPG